jgi:hypothetical protein
MCGRMIVIIVIGNSKNDMKIAFVHLHRTICFARVDYGLMHLARANLEQIRSDSPKVNYAPSGVRIWTLVPVFHVFARDIADVVAKNVAAFAVRVAHRVYDSKKQF